MKTLLTLSLPIVMASSAWSQTAGDLPKAVRSQYADAVDPSVSDEFSGTSYDRSKWVRRGGKRAVLSNFVEDKSLVTMGSDKDADGTVVKHVSIKGLARDPEKPARTAGLVSKASAYLGFYVVRFRLTGFDRPGVRKGKTIWHPSVWSCHGIFSPELRRMAVENGNWLEIDFFEWNGNGWDSDAPARFVDRSGKSRKVKTRGKGMEKAVMRGKKVGQYKPDWVILGLEYAPEHIKLWKWEDGKWIHFGERVVTFVDQNDKAPEKSYTPSTIGHKARKPMFWYLGNISILDQNKLSQRDKRYDFHDMSIDIDYFRYYRHKSVINTDWKWEYQLPMAARNANRKG